MSLLHYLLEANLYLVAFYALYYIIFSRETHYQLNRIYLLGSTILAFIIPMIQLGVLNPPAIQLQDVVITTIHSRMLSTPVQTVTDTSWPLVNYLLLAYGVIVFLLMANLLFKIYKLIRLSFINKTIEHSTFKLVELPSENNAFSFFNYLFISPALAQSPTIIQHELVHIKQKHSWDIIYLELLKVINWFNPVIYMMQNSVKEVHEFIADNQTVDEETNAAIYTDFLVSNAYGISENTLTSTFFNKNLLKKRIMMLHQKKSGNAARLKYLLIVPLICGLLCASTLSFAKSYGWIDLAPRYHSPAKLAASAMNTHKALRLKVIMGDNSFITDKISFKADNGKLKTYTVNSLTEDDKIYLLKAHQVKIQIVEIPVLSNVTLAKLNDPATDTLKYRSKSKAVTSKGYKFQESAYLVNKKTNYKVTITEKNGEQKEYYRNSATTAQLELLKDKYGYTFPTMDIFDRMPPPPPVGPAPAGPAAPGSKTPPPPPPARPTNIKADVKNPPPPPAPPKGDPDKDAVKPPPPPSEVILNEKTQGKIRFGDKLAHTTLYLPAQNAGKIAPPLILVNGEKYDLKSELKRGQCLYFNASDSTIQHSPGEMSAMRKWGNEAKNGVVELYGRSSVSIK